MSPVLGPASSLAFLRRAFHPLVRGIRHPLVRSTAPSLLHTTARSPVREEHHPFARSPLFGIALGAATLLGACSPAETADRGAPHVTAENSEEAGRYIVEIGGCNDCHTDRFMELGPSIPESERLQGSMLGFRGPWGTTFAPNLRLSAQSMTEDQWVEMLGTRAGLPPMPWPSVNAMNDTDRRAVYRYLRSIGAAGAVIDAALPPDVEPTGPWLDFVPRNLPMGMPAGT